MLDNVTTFLGLFQLTTSRRGRRCRVECGISRELFQLTTSRRGRHHAPRVDKTEIKNFNSRPHEEVDDAYFTRFGYATNFNSRPHEEVDVNQQRYRYYNFVISTHDLTKRSTT